MGHRGPDLVNKPTLGLCPDGEPHPDVSWLSEHRGSLLGSVREAWREFGGGSSHPFVSPPTHALLTCLSLLPDPCERVKD